ncbi:MAG TPA: extracellular solute-binding protein [Steroidobacteraceae bacterium]|nr:extracellular solute-binding protein [Steroidobacteraceae bacterium]
MLLGKHGLIAMLGVAASFMFGCGGSGTQPVQSAEKTLEDNVVNLYIWSDYLAPDTLTSFEKLTGIKVHVSYFDSYETMEARVLTGHSGFDVVLPTTGSFAREIRSGAYLPFDKTKLPNLINIDPAIMSKVSLSDPGNVYGVVYMWSTYGISFNKKLITERLPNTPLKSWRLVFDPVFAAKLASCGINFIDDPVGVVQIVLKYLGRDQRAPSDQDLAEVEKTLVKIRPYIRSIDSSGEIQALANGDICLSLGYSGDFVQASKRANEAKNGIELDYVIPEEGSLEGFDLLAIPRDAPHPSNAYRLINYLMDPQVAANISNVIGNANANLAATALLDASIVSNTAIYPTQDQQQRLFVQTESSSEQSRAITRIWQKFRTGQ